MKKLIFLFAFAFMQTTMQAQCSVSIYADHDTINCINTYTAMLATPSNGTAPYTYQWSSGLYANPAISYANGGGIYTVTITDATGCTATATKSIVQNIIPPSLQITASNNEITCTHPNVILTVTPAHPAYTYNWYSFNGQFTPQNNQATVWTGDSDYFVTVTDTRNGCTVSSVKTIVRNNALPNAWIDTNDRSLSCDGGTITLTATAGYAYLWNTGSSAASVTLNTVGNYTVTITNMAAQRQLLLMALCLTLIFGII